MRSLSLIFLLFTNFALDAQTLLSQAALKLEFDENVQNTGWSEASIFAHGLEFSSGFDKRSKKSLNFEHENQYLTIDAKDLDISNGLTINFWLYPENTGHPSIILSQGNEHESAAWRILLKSFQGKVISLWDLKGSGFFDENTHFRGYHAQKWGKNYQNWYFISVSFYKDSKVRFYINGVLVHESLSLKGMGGFQVNAPIILGNFPNRNLPESFNYFVGKLDNFSLFDKELSSLEIEELYFQQSQKLKDSWWLGQLFLREGMRKNVHRKNVIENKPINYCFYNNAHKINISDQSISYLLGQRKFLKEEFRYEYDSTHQVLLAINYSFDTLVVDKLSPVLFREVFEDLDKLILTNPVYRISGVDSLILCSMEMRYKKSGKRLLACNNRCDFAQKKRYYTTIEQAHEDLALARNMENTRIYLRGIAFDSKNKLLIQRSRTELEKIKALLRTYPSHKIDISSHNETNMNMATLRAKEIYNYLIQSGIEKERLTFGGYQKLSPRILLGDPSKVLPKNRLELELIEDNTLVQLEK